jgi:hypothetical protein
MSWIAPAIGLLTATLVAWRACPVPRLPTLSFVEMLWIALRYAALLGITAAIATALVRRALDRSVWRTAVVAVWLAPLAAFLASRSLWAAVAAIALGVAVARLASISPASERPRKMLLYTFGVAFLVQTALVALIAGPSAGAALLAGVGAAALALTIRANGWRIPDAVSTGRDSRGIALAMLLTLFALAPFLKPDLNDIENPAATAAAAAAGESARPALPGIILWPELPPQRIVVRPPRSEQSDPKPRVRVDEWSVPFFGVYWLYRAPQQQPPPNSIIERGTPAEHIFRSTDFRPLAMEARQNFGRFLDVSCCRAIQLAIHNEDPQPGTVWLDVFLADSSIALLPAQYLGRQPVEPSRDLLTFSTSRAPRHVRFDEIRIRYELDGRRARRSANVAIEKFVFVPR